MRDVAREAGVSVGIVSRILNNDETLVINKETRERVLQATKNLNYKFETKKRKKVMSISVVLVTSVREIDESDDPYYRTIRLAMENEITERKMILSHIIDVGNILTYQESLKKADVVVTLGTLDFDAIEQLYKLNNNIIVIDDPKVDSKYDVIYIDLEKETRISLDMLKSRGHKKIGFIGGYENRRGVEQTISSANEIRFEAYIRWMKEEGAENYINYQLGQWMPLSGYEMAKRMIELKDLPTAILFASDPLAIGAYKAFQENNIRIPEDIAIVSFDDVEITEFLTPTLTTVSFPASELGMMAARLAEEKIKEKRNVPLKISLPAKLVLRESV